MTEYAYNPIREPRKEVTHEEMMETLKRRIRESVEKHALSVKGGSGVAQSSRAPAVVGQEVPGANPVAVAALSWEKPHHDRDGAGQPTGTGYQLSLCHRFVIAKVRVNGEFKYTASQRRVDFPAQVLGSFKTPEEARACCEAHR